MQQPVLDIHGLKLDFESNGQHTPALHGIDLRVYPGEWKALVGESGSGKSVTALSVLRLLPTPPAVYTAGKILLTAAGEAISLLDIPDKKLAAIRGSRIGMIFQEPMSSLNPLLTCGFQVMEAIMAHQHITAQAAKEKTLTLFGKVQLPDPAAIFYRYPHQLSGGQKQRVMIAIAISASPELLICDEPTTALDVTVQKSILSLLRDLQKETGMAVLLITHDLGIVADVADSVAVMYRGHIVEDRKTKDLFTRPEHPYTKALLACRPALYPKNRRLPVVQDFMTSDEAGHIKGREPGPVSYFNKADDKKHKEPGNIITVKSLSVHFPGVKKGLFGRTQPVTAVNNVSFNVKEGEMVGLVGESGSGKTTIGRAILGLIPASSGSIFFRDKSLTGLTRQERIGLCRNLQLVFQDPYASLNPYMRIGEAIAEPLRVHTKLRESAIRERVMDMLEKVQLKPEHYHRYPHAFSGGQRQRIVLARALVLQPDFLVCDESISALDVSVQAQVLNLLQELKQQFQFSCVFISHDLSVVRYLCDRVLVLNRGRLEEAGDAESVYKNPASEYTRQLIRAIPGQSLAG
jgi:peptide/nickel transport system ATP-binding protein